MLELAHSGGRCIADALAQFGLREAGREARPADALAKLAAKGLIFRGAGCLDDAFWHSVGVGCLPVGRRPSIVPAGEGAYGRR